MAPLMRVLRVATIVLASACGADKLPPLSLIQSFNVTPSGGAVTLVGGAVTLNFPANAVSQSVEITATATTGPSSPTVVTGAVYSFQPSLTFNVAVPVTVKYQGATLPAGVRANELGLYKVVGSAWVRDSASTVDTTAKTVSASLTGFSVHGILGAPVASVSVTPPTPTMHVTDTLTLGAVPKDASSNALPSRAVSWSASNAAVASVSGAGLVTGVAVGTDTITATSEGVTGTAVVTVSLVPVASVTVSPAVDTIAVLGTAQLSATLKDAAGITLSGRVITWASSDTTKAKVSSTGLVTGVAAGTVTVTATSGGKSGNAAVTVTAQPASVASVTVSPAADTITVLATAQLTATLKDSLGNTLSGRVVTWSSSDSTKATVSSTGLVTGVAAGSSTVTATSGSKSGNAVITVTAASGATPVFSDNLESGAFSADQNGYGWGPGTYYGTAASVSSDRAHSGTHSVKVSYLPGWAQVNFHLGAYLTEVWFEYWLYVPTNFAMTDSPGPNNKFFLVWRDSYSLNQPGDDGGLGTVGFEYDGNTNGSAIVRGYSTLPTSGGVVVDFTEPSRADHASPVIGQWTNFINNGVTPVSPFSGPITPGTWAQIRIHMKTSSSESALDGALQLWVNGTLFFSITAANLFGDSATVGGQLHNGYILGYPDSQFAQATSFYIDDFKIYNANPGW